jgi:hypothetical protein
MDYGDGSTCPNMQRREDKGNERKILEELFIKEHW